MMNTRTNTRQEQVQGVRALFEEVGIGRHQSTMPSKVHIQDSHLVQLKADVQGAMRCASCQR
jgi:hypothetical protein